MYFYQLADTTHYYYLQFEGGAVMRGVCNAIDHLMMLVLFYFNIVSELDFAKLVCAKIAKTRCDADAAVSAVIADLDRSGKASFPDNIDEFTSEAGIRWDAARYELRHHDWLKQRGGHA